mgnify:CR=1 FL=1|jgi:type I restriction enzyme S subunit
MAKIGDVCASKIDTLNAAYNGKIDYIDISAVDNDKKKITNTETLQIKEAPSRARQLVECDDIIVSLVRPNLNAVAIVENSSENLQVASTGYCVLRCNQAVYSRYLFYFCQSETFINRMTAQATGASYPAVSNSIVKNCEIPLPERNKQKEIADILDKVTGLISLRKQQLAKLDELVKARFVEMFGDVLLNSMQWPEKTLERMADIVSGITKGRKTTETDLQEVPYMAVSNVKDGYIDWTTVKTILATRQEIEQYRLMPDDILMTEGGDPDKVGRGAIIKVPLKNSIHQNHIFRVRLNEQEILPSFFAEYLRHQKAKRYFLGCAKQTTGIASINMRQLRALPTLVPPLSLQKQFAAFVERVDQQKQTVQQSLEKLELMKKALMQEYFG